MAAAAYLPQFASSTSAGEYWQQHVKGHPMLAYFMGNAPLAAHVRRFATLSMRNILYLQAEIQFLEKKLLLAEIRDSRSGRGKESSYSLNWQDLKDSANSENKEQYELIRDLRRLMEEYEQALLRHRELAKTEVNSWQLREVQECLDRDDMCGAAMTGVDACIWGSVEDPDGYALDLMAISSARTKGHFAKWIVEKFVPSFYKRIHYRFKKRDRDGLFSYDEDRLCTFISIIANTAAFLISYAAIASLYFARSAAARLVIALIFSAMYSVCMVTIGGDGFAGTAAFAAILAALITNNNSFSGQT